MGQQDITTLATFHSGLSCPRCASDSYRRHGRHLGIQRFRCKQCGRTFKETVNTPLHWIHDKQKMQNYLTAMYGKQSIRTASKNIAISVPTSFRWRHRILSSLFRQTPSAGIAPVGICEIRLPHSYKGRRNPPTAPMQETRSLLASDARGVPCLQMLSKKNIVAEASAILNRCLKPSVEIASVQMNLTTRVAKKTTAWISTNLLRKKSIAALAWIRAQAVSDWMARFCGVATRYLQQYWNWYRAEVNSISLEIFQLECFGQRHLQAFRQL